MNVTPGKNASSGSSNDDLRYVKLKNTLLSLFPTIHDIVLEKLMIKLQWEELKRGELLFHEGEEGDSLYILVSGRMKAVVRANTSQEREVGEISQGECVGEMALITGEARTASVYAVRDCTLVRLSKTGFNELMSLHPELVMNISRLIINRLTYTMHHAAAPAKTFTIALVPASRDIPVQALSEQLMASLSSSTRAKHVRLDKLPEKLRNQLTDPEEEAFELNNWFTEQELDQDFVVYQAEPSNSVWTKQCLRQADKIIIVTKSDAGISLTKVEEEVFFNANQKHIQTKELVILYPEDAERPTISHQILSLRKVSRHYNIRQGDKRHIDRLARMITDRGIGLVLGGGGAKGFAHLGIYKALQEAGVPIDMVCGTSIGAIMAAAIAHEWTVEETMHKGRSAFIVDKPLNDYTLPIVSLIKGHKVQRVNKKYFGDYHIEDLWLNFFCISSNYTLSEMVVHEKGPLWKAVTASVSIPGVLPPVVEGNNLLIDGGSFNNFPVDVMKARYGGKLIGINLLVDKEYELDYTLLPGGWYMFLARFLPFLKRYKTPSMSAIMLKSTILSSMVHQRNQLEDLELFMTPPVANFSLLDMRNFDRIVATGYEYGKKYLKTADLSKLIEVKEEVASVKV